METYVLSLDNLNKATTAKKEIQKVVAADPSVEQATKNFSADTLDQKFKRVDSNPKIAGAIHRAGLTAKDFILTAVCAITAYLFSDMKKNGVPPDQMEQAQKMSPWKPSPEQVAFVDAHHAEVQEFVRTMQDK